MPGLTNVGKEAKFHGYVGDTAVGTAAVPERRRMHAIYTERKREADARDKPKFPGRLITTIKVT